MRLCPSLTDADEVAQRGGLRRPIGLHLVNLVAVEAQSPLRLGRGRKGPTARAIRAYRTDQWKSSSTGRALCAFQCRPTDAAGIVIHGLIKGLLIARHSLGYDLRGRSRATRAAVIGRGSDVPGRLLYLR